MIKKIFVVFALLVLIVGCKPKEVAEERPSGAYPYELRVSVDNGTVKLSWKKHGDALIGGYNIYISETSLAAQYPDGHYPVSVPPFNRTPFPGDTDPTDGIEHFQAEGLTNGVMYYVSVVVVNPDRSLSRSTEEITVVPAPTGEIELAARYQGEQDGYAFYADRYVRADAVENDVYYYYHEDKHYLASPTRLDGFLRKSLLLKLPFRGDYEEVRSRIVENEYQPSEERVEIKTGDWVLILTADSHYVLVRVLELTGQGQSSAVRLFFAVSGIENRIFF